MWHKIWRVVKPFLEVLAAVVLLLVLILIPTLTGSTASVQDNLSAFAVAPLGSTGPLTGDLSVVQNEVSCMQQYVKDPANNYTNYPPVIGAPEHTDAIHSGVQPCATFTGSFSGKNQVYQYQSQTAYPGGVQFVVFGGPNEAFLQGGGLGSPSSGQYVSRFDPSTGREIWRTYLTNVNTNGQWIAFGSIAVLKDGSVGVAAGPWVYRLDPDTGAILAAAEQPILGMPSTDANFDGFQVAPDSRGTILLKTQNQVDRVPDTRQRGDELLHQPIRRAARHHGRGGRSGDIEEPRRDQAEPGGDGTPGRDDTQRAHLHVHRRDDHRHPDHLEPQHPDPHAGHVVGARPTC